MTNPIGKTIQDLRKQKNLTQSDLAEVLNVSTAAVSKWESDHSYPDINLLTPLARLLSVDMNTLLGFEEKLTVEEVNVLFERVNKVFQQDYYQASKLIHDYLHEYPNDPYLYLRMAHCLFVNIAKVDEVEVENTVDDLIAMHYRVVELDDGDLKETSILMLSSLLQMREKYDEALELLQTLPEDKQYHKTQMQAALHLAKKEFDSCEELLTREIFLQFNNLIQILSLLAALYKKKENIPVSKQILEDTLQLTNILNIHYGIVSNLYYELLHLSALEKDTAQVYHYLELWISTLRNPIFPTNSLYLNTEQISKVSNTDIIGNMKILLEHDEALNYLREEPLFIDFMSELEKLNH